MPGSVSSLPGAPPPGDAGRSARGRPSLGPVAVTWLFLVILTSIPYLRAWLYPPRGMAFLGFFYSIPDVYNYLSYVQQAQDGAFLFVNKLTLEDHPPALVHLEWWTVGRLSALLGGHPTLAYRLLGIAALFVLVVLVDRWLRLAGLPEGHRLFSLLLVFTGGGLGGILFELFGPPAWRFLDLVTGLYPFIAALVNPHFVLGTALLLGSLLAFQRARSWPGHGLAVLTGSVLALVRPYDLVLLVGVRVLVVALTLPPRAWIRSASSLLGLLPAVVYNYWIFYRNPAFTVLSGFAYRLPPLGSHTLALAPAALLAILGWTSRARAGEYGYTAQAHLLAWIAVGAAILLSPFPFALQCLSHFGLPLLALSALGLARFKPVVTLATAAAFSTTGLLAVRLLLEDNPAWFVPAERLAAAQALRSSCGTGDLLMAPPDVGLYANAFSACKAYLAHGIVKDYAERDEQGNRFYGTSAPAWRAAFLDRGCITRLVLPGDPGPRPQDWLGEETPFRRIGRTGAISLYARERPPSCRPPGP